MKDGAVEHLSLKSRNTRIQFDIAIALISIIPMLALALLYVRALLEDDRALGTYGLILPVALVLAILGHAVLSKYPVTVLKLRKYLEDIVRGDLPLAIQLDHPENDIQAIERCLNTILGQLKKRVAEMEMEQLRLEMQLCQAQKLRAIGTLASGIAHEINTPIQFVSDNTRFLSESCGSVLRILDQCKALLGELDRAGLMPETVGRVRGMQKEADLDFLEKEIPAAITQSLEGLAQAAEITRAMKDFSSMAGDDGKVEADLNRAVERTIVVTRNEWKYVAEIGTDLDPSLPLVTCHLGDIKQVLVNLIVNAAHAVGDVVRMNPGSKGRIVVSTRCEDGYVRLSVKDTGTGIAPEIRDRIFEPFFTTKSGGKGTGQGLAISRSLVAKKHGGDILVDTEVGSGSTFTIRLPLKELSALPAEVAR